MGGGASGRRPVRPVAFVACVLALAACGREGVVWPPHRGEDPATLTVGQDSVVLALHEGFRISAQVSGLSDGSISFRSSDTTVVTVDGSGTVRAVGYGAAYVYVSATASPALARSVFFRVPAGPGVWVALSPDTASLHPGSGLQLLARAGGASEQGVRFRSSDSSIVEVSDSGLACGRRLGEAVVRATALADTLAADSSRLRVIPWPPGIVTAPPTLSFRSLTDSTGQRVDSAAVRGRIAVTVFWDSWRCAPRFTPELRVDGVRWAAAPEVRWGGSAPYTFLLDTRATDGEGKPRLPNGPHVLSAVARAPDGTVLMSASLALVIAN